jgi:hypothetical protein
LRCELVDTANGHVREGFASGLIIADPHAFEGAQAGLDQLPLLVVVHGPYALSVL